MMTSSRLRALALLFAATACYAAAPPPDHWVGTWATANLDRSNMPRPNAPANAPAPFFTEDTTLRQIVHISIGGTTVRVDLSNQFGTEPLTISAAHLALAAPGNKGEITLPSASALTFGGKPGIIIPPGAHIISDPIAMKVENSADLAISLFIPAQKISHITQHGSAYQTNFMAPGNVVGEKTLPDTAKTFANWFFLKAVDVKAPAAAGSIVAFGDSITDGTYSSPDQNRRWPDFLARRLMADKKLPPLGVLNEGIGGNRILHDGTGPNALARFDADVLALDGVKYLIILESINDIGHAFDSKKPYDVISAADLIQGITEMVERAHEHGIKVFGATLTPYLGAGYASPEGEQARQAVNTFIRTDKMFDGVIDFEAATIDKSTGAFDTRYNAPPHADHLHPNDAGMEAMAGAIDLKLFEK